MDTSDSADFRRKALEVSGERKILVGECGEALAGTTALSRASCAAGTFKNGA